MLQVEDKPNKIKLKIWYFIQNFGYGKMKMNLYVLEILSMWIWNQKFLCVVMRCILGLFCYAWSCRC